MRSAEERYQDRQWSAAVGQRLVQALGRHKLSGWPFKGSKAAPRSFPVSPHLNPQPPAAAFGPYLDRVGALFAEYERGKAIEARRAAERADAPTADEIMEAVLHTVPAHYFAPDFDLAGGATFASAVATSEAPGSRLDPAAGLGLGSGGSSADLSASGSAGESGRGGAASGALTVSPAARMSLVLAQEKLSHFLDVIEIQLSRAVAHRSLDFFSALANLQGLHTQVGIAVVQIGNLRRIIRAADEAVTGSVLEVANLRTRREHARQAAALLARVQAVSETPAAVEAMLGAGDFATALELIRSTRTVLDGELRGVYALRSMPAALDDLASVVESLLTSEFLACVRTCVETADRERIDGAGDGGPGAGDGPGGGDTVLINRLEPLVRGLLELGRGGEAVGEARLTFLEVVNETVVGCVKPALSAFEAEARAKRSDPDWKLPGSTLGEQLGSLDHGPYGAILDGVFRAELGVLRAAASFRDHLVVVFEHIKGVCVCLCVCLYLCVFLCLVCVCVCVCVCFCV